MNAILESKFHIGRELTFAFIDSWAKHPANLDDAFQQAAFDRETSVLWDVTVNSEEFVFKSLEDILNENHELKVIFVVNLNFKAKQSNLDNSWLT